MEQTAWARSQQRRRNRGTTNRNQCTGRGGPAGPAGPAGTNGVQGPQGSTGLQGLKGDTGRGVSTLSIINGRLNATFTDTGATLFDLGNVVGPQGPTGPTGSTASGGAVTKIIAGQNVTISPSSGLGDVTINSMGCYILKLEFNSASLNTTTPVVLTSDPSGNPLVGWTFTYISASSFSFRPPVGFRLLGYFHRYTQNNSSASYLIAAFSVGNVTGAYVQYNASTNTYTIAGLTSSLSGIDGSLSPGYMYITFNTIANSTLFI